MRRVGLATVVVAGLLFAGAFAAAIASLPDVRRYADMRRM